MSCAEIGSSTGLRNVSPALGFSDAAVFWSDLGCEKWILMEFNSVFARAVRSR